MTPVARAHELPLERRTVLSWLRSNIWPIIGALVSALLLGLLAIKLVEVLGVSLDLAMAGLSATTGALIGVGSRQVVSLVRKVRSTPRVFVSYAYGDESRLADRAVYVLREAGVKLWIDAERMKPGETWGFEALPAIRNSDSMIVLLSRRPSPYLRMEVEEARRKGLKVVPVILETTEIPREVAGLVPVDLREDRAKGLERMISSVM